MVCYALLGSRGTRTQIFLNALIFELWLVSKKYSTYNSCKGRNEIKKKEIKTIMVFTYCNPTQPMIQRSTMMIKIKNTRSFCLVVLSFLASILSPTSISDEHHNYLNVSPCTCGSRAKTSAILCINHKSC